MVPAGDGIFEPALMPPQGSKALSPMSLPGLENFSIHQGSCVHPFHIFKYL